MSSNQSNRYRFLDALRGVAILWIACFHMMRFVREHYGTILNGIIENGYFGVIIFFVISGYGIGISKNSNRYQQSPHLFLVRRLKRIYFPYWWSLIITAIMVPLVQIAAIYIKTRSFQYESPYSFFEWIQVISLLKIFSADSWTVSLAFDPLNAPIWFIAITVQIYAFIALSFYAKQKSGLVLFIGALASLICYIPLIKEFIPFGLFVPYFFHVYIGYLVYVLIQKRIYISNIVVNLFVSVVLLVASIFLLQIENDFSDLLFALFIGYVSLFSYQYDRKLIKTAFVKFFYILGIFSYSIYLLHFPLRIPAGLFSKYCFPFLGEYTRPIAIVIISIILSSVWYFFFEKPSKQVDVLRSLGSPFKTIKNGLVQVVSKSRAL